MRIVILPVGRCRFLEENESGLRFRRKKNGGLWNVRPLIIVPLNFINSHVQVARKFNGSTSTCKLKLFSQSASLIQPYTALQATTGSNLGNFFSTGNHSLQFVCT